MSVFVLFLGLFIVTLIGGALPLFIKLSKELNNLLLIFSGSLLLGVNFMHLLPEVFEDLGFKAGIYILGGFFLQQFIQKFTHGLEHGHTHIHTPQHEHHIALTPILLGLSVHAFMEGLPLGYEFRSSNTLPSLFLGIASHKAPEALTLMSVVATMPYSNSKKIMVLLLFALVTPIAGIFALLIGHQYYFISHLFTQIVPVVIGAFIHISTTIFFEGGTKNHDMSWKKVVAIMIGIGVSLLTLL